MAVALDQAGGSTVNVGPNTVTQLTWGTKPAIGSKVIGVFSTYNSPGALTIADDVGNTYRVAVSTDNGTTAQYQVECDCAARPAYLRITSANAVYGTLQADSWTGVATGAASASRTAIFDTFSGATGGYTVGPTAAACSVGALIVSGFGCANGANPTNQTGPTGGTLIGYEPDSAANQAARSGWRLASTAAVQSDAYSLGSGGGIMNLTLAVFEPAAGGGGVSVALTGVSSSATIGTLAAARSKALVGNIATGAVGAFGKTRTKALVGNIGTGSVGALAKAATVPLSGVASAASVGAMTVAGSPNVSAALVGVSSAGSVGALGVARSVPVVGVAGAASVGALAGSTSTALAGVSTTGAVGALSVPSGVTVALTGVASTASVGLLARTGAVGLTGVAAVASVGVLAVAGAQPVGPGRPVVEFVSGSSARPRYQRDPNHVPILQRALAAKAARYVKPAQERAQRRAKAIEQDAARRVLAEPDMPREKFERLVDRWLAERPQLDAGADAIAQFLAQVGLRLQQLQAQAAVDALLAHQRDEEDAIALLLL